MAAKGKNDPSFRAARTINAAAVLEALVAGQPWHEARMLAHKSGKWAGDIDELLAWAASEVMPQEVRQRGRNIWLARYQELFRLWWPKAMEGDREAAQMVMQIASHVRTMGGLDEPKRLEHGSDPERPMRMEVVIVDAITDAVEVIDEEIVTVN